MVSTLAAFPKALGVRLTDLLGEERCISTTERTTWPCSSGIAGRSI